MGTFHFLFNYSVFMINYLNQNYVWSFNCNGIGEAHFEAVFMTVTVPFVMYGLVTAVNDLKLLEV